MNVVDAIAIRFSTVTGIDEVIKRQLHPEDPSKCLAVWPDDWNPTSFEIGQIDPAMSRYIYGVAYMTKTSDPEEGVADAALVAKTIRVMLYRDTALLQTLRQLNDPSLGMTERYLRHGASQKFFSNTIADEFVTISTLKLWVDTEIT